MQRVYQYFRGLLPYIDRGWFLPVVALSAFLDFFILIIPTDALLVSGVLLRPRRWFFAAVIVAVGSTLGAYLLAWGLQYDPTWLTEHFPRLMASEGWKGMDTFLDRFGFWALALLALGPLPFQPAVILLAVAGTTAEEIALGAFVGRFSKYLLFSYLASHAPKYLERFDVRKELAQLGEEKLLKEKETEAEKKKTPSPPGADGALKTPLS